MKEVWREIKGYEGLYEVSNLGRIKSLNYRKTGKEWFLKPILSNNNYFHVNLYKNGKRKPFLIHRLVAEAFLDNPDNLPCINHKDEVKTNNSVDNLEFCSIQYNMTYNDLHLRRAEKCKKKVGCYQNNKLIKIYNAITDVDKDGFHYQCVIKCCKRKRNHHHGFQWKYL